MAGPSHHSIPELARDPQSAAGKPGPEGLHDDDASHRGCGLWVGHTLDRTDDSFGLHSSKMLVEAGVSGFHIDDMLSGSKRFDKSDGVGGVLVPLSEFTRRLVASQMQLDIMK